MEDKYEQNLFQLAIKDTYKLGGETDSNCNSVGGLVGALVGVENINNVLMKNLLDCDISLGMQRNRPIVCQPSQQSVENIITLTGIAPHKLKVVGGLHLENEFMFINKQSEQMHKRLTMT